MSVICAQADKGKKRGVGNFNKRMKIFKYVDIFFKQNKKIIFLNATQKRRKNVF